MKVSSRGPKPWCSLILRNLKEELKQESSLDFSLRACRAVLGLLKFRVIAAHWTNSPQAEVYLPWYCGNCIYSWAVVAASGGRGQLESVCCQHLFCVRDSHTLYHLTLTERLWKKGAALPISQMSKLRLRGEEVTLEFVGRQVCKSCFFPSFAWERNLSFLWGVGRESVGM